MIETTGNRMMTMRTTDKPFNITKKQVYEAYKAVKSNQGAAGVDKETIEQFESNLEGDLYKLWNRTLLQMQCAKLFGEANYSKLDHLTISMAHPDALAALLAGSRGSITAHFGQSPFQDLELRDPKIHTVLTSHDVLNGPASSELLATTAAFRQANPDLYKAVFSALEEAIKVINEDRRRAVQIYVEEAQAKDTPEMLESVISSPSAEYSVVPKGVMKYAEFIHKVGRIKQRPEQWSDLFFPEIHNRPGS
jgi:NitT/TauT family transport system substrate-binding protein